MVISNSVLRGKTVVFTSFIPSANPCEASSGTGYLMVLNRATGGRTVKTPFDVNNDNAFTMNDYLSFGDTGKEIASGVKITGGGTPGFILSDKKDRVLISQFDGNIEDRELDLGLPVRGRQTWRQIR